MIVNQNTAIIGTKVVLVPYRPEHVPTYHKWMLSEELCELTASEPLTLDQEYEMQRKWQTDTDKLTFIILARPHLVSQSDVEDVRRDEWESSSPPLSLKTFAQLPMVGDVNLFVKSTSECDVEEVEAEVMVAEDAYRRKGVAFDALRLLFHYATSPNGPPSLRLPMEKFVVRIGENNYASQRLFEKLGFVVTKQVPVFHEAEMCYTGGSQWTGGKIIALD